MKFISIVCALLFAIIFLAETMRGEGNLDNLIVSCLFSLIAEVENLNRRFK